jgi:hypothetical protein
VTQPSAGWASGRGKMGLAALAARAPWVKESLVGVR